VFYRAEMNDGIIDVQRCVGRRGTYS